jgi:hypothetical protein
LHKLMVDTNVFYYIYNNDLSTKVKYFVDNTVISMFVTSVQWAEIDAKCDIEVNCEIKKYCSRLFLLKLFLCGFLLREPLLSNQQ